MIEFFDNYIIKYYGSDLVQFENERKAYQFLNNYNITPKILGIGKDYIKIERYGVSLAQLLDNKQVNQVQLLDIYIQLSSLLRKMDYLGIIHNDLALRNVVCKPYGKYYMVRLIDFGKSVITPSITVKNSNFNTSFYNQFSF